MTTYFKSTALLGTLPMLAAARTRHSQLGKCANEEVFCKRIEAGGGTSCQLTIFPGDPVLQAEQVFRFSRSSLRSQLAAVW
ncbi:MAG: hypothetical protein H0V72_08745 [Bradyrhizobium sp.]|nr:hypothetical protein [Bradyrhizobium sp.]